MPSQDDPLPRAGRPPWLRLVDAVCVEVGDSRRGDAEVVERVVYNAILDAGNAARLLLVESDEEARDVGYKQSADTQSVKFSAISVSECAGPWQVHGACHSVHTTHDRWHMVHGAWRVAHGA